MRRSAKWLIATLLALPGLGLVLYYTLSEPLPHGQTGAEADALAHALQQAVDVEAWKRTLAVRFQFGSSRRYLWDRERGFARVEWDDERVLLRLKSHDGRVFHDGLPLWGDSARHLLDRASRFFAHDSFWLNPLATLFDPGVARELVRLPDGERTLLVRYSRGELTAGDSYLWLPGTGGLPRAWKMWVSIMPLGGVKASWERWQTLRTGAKVATLHRLSARWISLHGVAGASSLRGLGAPGDPFALLLPRAAQRDHRPSGPDIDVMSGQRAPGALAQQGAR